MAPGSDERHPPPPPHTGTVPKTKVRNCVVPQEAVTPTRRDINSANLASSSLEWVSVPVSEYNQRQNYTQSSRKATNSSAEHDFSDLDTSVSLESALQRFVPVRPQPRGLPLPPMQPPDQGDDSLLPYHQSTPNGVSPHANHGAAAVMIVNPTTPNTLTGNMSHQYNVSSNTNRNNLARSLHTSRSSDVAGSSHPLSGHHQHAHGSHTARKANNINTYEQQPQAAHRADVTHMNGGEPASAGDGARTLTEALVTTCPDPASVERRLGQIREYIRVTSSLVDTMRNSEDEEARPVSVQSTGSAYSDSELWQSELKNKMEVSQQRLAALQDQQKRLLKYQAEAKQHLADMQNLARSRQSQDNLQNHSTPTLDNTHSQNQFPANHQQSYRVYNSNQIGVATTLPQTSHASNIHSASVCGSADGYRSGVPVEADSTSHGHVSHHVDDRFALRNTALMPHVSDGRSEEEETGGSAQEMQLTSQGLELQSKLRALQRKKQHMENLVAEFQNLQVADLLLGAGAHGGEASAAAGRGGEGKDSHNTYSSDESSTDDMTPHSSMKVESNMKNEDPFKLMEISAIKAALQKTKDLMRTVERYEPSDSTHNEHYQLSNSNINDNKSEGGQSGGEWSTEGSVCRSIRNAIQPNKLNKRANRAHGTGASGSGAHEASISSLQLLAQQLRQEAEDIASERQRLQQSIQRTNKDGVGKLSKKKLLRGTGPGATPTPQAGGGGGGQVSPGPLERKQQALRAELAEKQRQLEMILSKEKELSGSSDVHKMKGEPCSYSTINQSYNSEQEGDSQAEDALFPTHAHSQSQHHHYRSADGSMYDEGGDSGSGALPPHLPVGPAPGPAAGYYSDSDNASRCKSDTRSSRCRRNRPEPPERTIHEHVGVSGEPLPPPPHALHPQPGESNSSTPTYPPPLAPPTHSAWGNKSNQDVRSNQFTQNSHSQTTMERLLGMQLPYPPALQHFNMMMPLGAYQGGGAACGCWGPWCWQQLAVQQREIHQLREQLSSLEERWRAETAPHALNNQVPPGNRANNYWDNFRSYSRQNLLSSNSKTNADGHLGSVPPHNPHPLVARSHNALHPSPAPPPPVASPPAHTPKRNTNRHNFAYDTQHSLVSAPDVLNVNQHIDQESGHVNINRDNSNSLPERNLNIAEPIPEIIQAHSNNLNRTQDSLNSKMKSSSKLPAKNSGSRRNYSLDYVQNGNINIASTSDGPNPNLVSTNRDKTTKMFDTLRQNVYSEVTALISANESHPDFLIQLFRELQNVSSDSLRQNALLSIRNLLSHNVQQDNAVATESASSDMAASNLVTEQTFTNATLFPTGRDGGPIIYRDIIDFMIARGEEICTPDLLESFKLVIINSYIEASQSMPYSHKRLQELLSKYEGVQLREVSGDIIDDLLSVPLGGQAGRRASEMSDGMGQHANDCGDAQGVASGYSGWDSGNTETGSGRPVDLIECAEMYNGDLAEADQTCSSEPEPPMPSHDAGDLLPDLVETEEITPTEAEAEWLGLDRVPTRLHTDESPANQKD